MPETAGAVVRTRREEIGLTREALALRSEVSTSTLARLELKDHIPSARALARIAAAINVPLATLLPEQVAS